MVERRNPIASAKNFWRNINKGLKRQTLGPNVTQLNINNNINWSLNYFFGITLFLSETLDIGVLGTAYAVPETNRQFTAHHLCIAGKHGSE